MTKFSDTQHENLMDTSASGRVQSGSVGPSESRQGVVHAIRQPLQSSMAWVDVCRQHLAKGNVEAADETLTKIAMLIEKCDAAAVKLINERLSGDH